MDSTDGIKLSEKVKLFLSEKFDESKYKVKKLKRKRLVYKILFTSTAGGSIIISVVLASISSLALPPIVIPILSITTGILTGLSAKFNFQDNKDKLSKEIQRLDKLQNKINYVISCNGDLTEEQFNQIISEFTK
jgi:hypothetical protein